MKELKFVDVGEGITEGQIHEWMVKDGDTVKEDQPVVKVETDKAVVEVPAPVGGIIKINKPANSTVHIGDTLAYFGTADEIRNIGQATPQPAVMISQKVNLPQPQAQQAPTPQVRQRPKEIIATPSVRHLAHELNVDISKVAGTGPEGRILENDIRATVGKTTGAPHAAPEQKFSEVREEQHAGQIERVPMTMTRKAIARAMTESNKIPVAAHMDRIDATELYNLVTKEKATFQQTMNVKLTFLPIIIKALVKGLQENPRFNASYDADKQEIILKRYYNIGLAAEAPDGLKIVVIKDADKKSIAQLASEIGLLHAKILNNTITVEEMRDSTFTITNIGSMGGGYLSVPIINPPEVGILGIHLIRDEPMVRDGKIVIGKQLPFSLVFDHRVVDGADAVKLGNALIKYLEDPELLEMI